MAAFETDLTKIIDAEIERLKNILAAGQAPKDFADYRFITGQILAYGRVVDSYIEEATKESNKR